MVRTTETPNHHGLHGDKIIPPPLPRIPRSLCAPYRRLSSLHLHPFLNFQLLLQPIIDIPASTVPARDHEVSDFLSTEQDLGEGSCLADAEGCADEVEA